MDDSTSFTIDIETNARGVTEATSAVDILRQRLVDAGQASSKAAEAVRASEAAYKQAEVGASRAAQAFEKVGLAVDAQAAKVKQLTDAGDTKGLERASAKLEELKARQQELGQKAQEAKAALAAEAAALDKVRASAKSATEAEEKISEAHEKAKDNLLNVQKAQEAAAGSGKVNEMAEAFGKLGGPLGVAGQKALGAAEGVKKLMASLGTGAGPYIAITIAVVALASAFAIATVSLLKYAYANSEAARTSLLLSQGIAGSVAGGAALEAKISALSKSLPQSRDELRSMAAELAKSGLQGDALAEALEKSATTAAQTKFGPDFQKALLSSEKQSQILKDNLAGIFSLKTDGLAGGVAKLIALFDTTSASGSAIKTVFSSLFQPLIDGLDAAMPKIVRGFLQFEIYVLKVLIVLKSYGPQLIAIGKVVLTVAAVIGVAIGTVIAVLAAFVAISVAVGLAIWTIALQLGELISQGEQFAAAFIAGPGGAFDWVKTKIGEVVDWLSGLSLGEIGANIIRGLADGIKGAAGAVVDSLTGAVTGAVDAAKNFLGIHSPSTVMREEVGQQMGAGAALGVDDTASDVQSSLSAMVATPDVPPGAGGGAAAGSPRIQIIIQAASGAAEDIANAVRRALDEYFEGAVVQIGGELPEGAS